MRWRPRRMREVLLLRGVQRVVVTIGAFFLIVGFVLFALWMNDTFSR